MYGTHMRSLPLSTFHLCAAGHNAAHMSGRQMGESAIDKTNAECYAYMTQMLLGLSVLYS